VFVDLELSLSVVWGCLTLVGLRVALIGEGGGFDAHSRTNVNRASFRCANTVLVVVFRSW
jgi:hypothetical protein